jgi:hypothetical protein
MTQKTPDQLPGTSRRRMLEIMGTAAVALPVLGLSACGGEKESAKPAASSAPAAKIDAMAKEATQSMEAAAEKTSAAVDDAMQDASAAAEDMAQEVADEGKAAMDTIASDASGAMAKLDENGAQAMGLGYRHDATTVENARYKSGQQCSNCALYQGGDSAWGGCPLFTGKQVKATGWCSAYSPAA